MELSKAELRVLRRLEAEFERHEPALARRLSSGPEAMPQRIGLSGPVRIALLFAAVAVVTAALLVAAIASTVRVPCQQRPGAVISMTPTQPPSPRPTTPRPAAPAAPAPASQAC